MGVTPPNVATNRARKRSKVLRLATLNFVENFSPVRFRLQQFFTRRCTEGKTKIGASKKKPAGSSRERIGAGGRRLSHVATGVGSDVRLRDDTQESVTIGNQDSIQLMICHQLPGLVQILFGADGY
jgi:hypothetical protein